MAEDPGDKANAMDFSFVSLNRLPQCTHRWSTLQDSWQKQWPYMCRRTLGSVTRPRLSPSLRLQQVDTGNYSTHPPSQQVDAGRVHTQGMIP